MISKNFSLAVVFFVFVVAMFSSFFLFSEQSNSGMVVWDEPLYSWVYNSKKVFVYPTEIVAYQIDTREGTGSYYFSPLYRYGLNKRAGCPKDCYSIRYEHVKDLESLGFKLSLFGNRLYACWCPGYQ